MRHWWVIPAAAFLFVLPALACGGGTPTPKGSSGASTAHRIGETVAVKNWALTVQTPERPGKELIWSQVGNKSAAAGAWLIVPVDLRNTGGQNFGVNTFDFELRDGAGAVYNVSSDVGAYGYAEYKQGAPLGGQIPPGVTVRTYVIFDTNPDATGLRLIFKQDTKPQFMLDR
jgi:hypothetical protein